MRRLSGQPDEPATASAVPVLLYSPRYTSDLLTAVVKAGFAISPSRSPDNAVSQLLASDATDAPFRLVIVDARGALTQGLAVARALGHHVQSRLGAMLVLLSRGDGGSALAAHDAGATSVLISPFGTEALGNALRLSARQVERLARAASLEAEPKSQVAGDPLTGLATGDQLQQWITDVLAAPAPAPLHVLAIGVGRLAPINAAYGRDVADQALAAAAQRLTHLVDQASATLSGNDLRMLARVAAAEFGLALSTTADPAETRRIATDLSAKVAEAFEQPFVVGDHVIHLSGRVGIALDDAQLPARPPEKAAALLRRATSALAGARTREAGSVEIFTHHPAGDPLTRMANLQAELHRAIDGGGIHLLYQPQVAMEGRRITGVEALVRWDHPELGLLPAETLLETAASAELAVRLGRYIRARAMTEAARWQGALAGLKLSVNVTASDLADPRFVTALDLALDGSGLARDRLILEVTEGALIDDVRGAACLLEGLRATGVQVALDDFGTGFSSMSWLARLPIDAIKLDRAFTLSLSASERERTVVETLIDLGRRLGLSVIAEGVEDDRQYEAARRAGCDGVQGFHIAPPLDTAGLSAFCASWSHQPQPG